ncbi:hypothetical protein ACOKM5_24665 [Streptomyces sp. BH097]|uniref:hypothetical protein n=1 Tax=unclassified Streptomyces TaxID=2593676 RepID=UPI003BB52939
MKDWLTPADAKETAARAKQLALSVLPPGESAELSAAHLVQVDPQVSQPPARLRPDAFDGSPGLLTRAGEMDDRLFRLNPVNALVRGGKEREAMRGDWESAAGLLVRALVPRSWATVLFTSDGSHAVGRTFPQRLPYSAPRPGGA